MSHMEKTLTQFLIEQRRNTPGVTSGDLNSLVSAVATACKITSRKVAMGHLRTGSEDQPPLEDEALDIFVSATHRTGLVCGTLSDRKGDPTDLPPFAAHGHYALVFDPLDGASNLEVNTSVGSIFSILRTTPGHKARDEDFLQPGSQQVCAGYAIYGPATMLVLSLGHGTHGFTLDPLVGEWFLTHPYIKVPESTQEFAINSSYTRFWEPPVKRYVDECLAGKAGERGKDFNMRWVASLVADAHRILMRGGVFLYPRLTKQPAGSGRLLLLQEVNPVGLLIKEAGGKVTTGTGSPLHITPTGRFQRTGFIFGSANEVRRLERYYENSSEHIYTSPLFGERGLFADRD